MRIEVGVNILDPLTSSINIGATVTVDGAVLDANPLSLTTNSSQLSMLNHVRTGLL